MALGEHNDAGWYPSRSTVFALRTAHKRYITALHSSPSAPFKKMTTFHLYTTAGAHYNTIEPCQSNFVRVNRPGESMRSGLYKHLKLDQSQSKDRRLRIKRLCVLCCFRAAKNAAINSNTTYIMSTAIWLLLGLAQFASVQPRPAMLQYNCIMSK